MSALKLNLAKLLSDFAEIVTDKGELYCEGEPAVGTEVYIEQDDQFVPAPDGEYTSEKTVYVVEGGKIAEIRESEPEQSEEEPIVEEVKEVELAEEEPAAETEEAPVVEEPKEEAPDYSKDIAELTAENTKLTERISSLEVLVQEIQDRILGTEQKLTETVNAFSKFSVAKPADVEIKNSTVEGGLTGDAEYDKKIQQFRRGCK